MEISTGQLNKAQKNGLLEEINSIQDKNSKQYRDKIRELETVLGIKDINIFGTANKKIFEENLDNMSDVEIRSLASKLKIDPSGVRPVLKKRLLQQFDTQNVQSRGYLTPATPPKQLFSDEQRQKLTKILNG